MKTQSIAARLIAAVLVVELASSILVIMLSLGYERHSHFRSFDVMLRGRADSVLGAVQDAEDSQDNVMLDRADLDLPSEDIYEVYDGNGRLLGRSPNWRGETSEPPSKWKDGFSRFKVNDHHYRVLTMHGMRVVDPGEQGGGTPRQVVIRYGSPTEHVWKAIRGAVEFYAGGSIVLLAVTGPLIAWLLHRGLLPLRQLAQSASRVSVNSWQFNPSTNARTTRELAPLTQALETVLQGLERSFNQQKIFVSDAAHELKTAVAVVKSSLQLLNMRRRSAVEYQAGLERSLNDCERLEEIVAKMLTLARQESGPRTQGDGEVVTDAAACLRRTADHLQSIARVRGVEIVVAIEDYSNPVIATEEFSLLASNLLLNAVQHSTPGSEVRVHLGAQQDVVVLRVEDKGDGIDPADLPRIFDRFYRGDPSRARSTGGTGLGLAISKAIVERAGGQIEIVSALGSGTTVAVNLPRACDLISQS